MALGAHGGDHIPQGTLQLLLNVVEFGRDPQEAVEEPRFYSYNFPSTNWASKYEPGMLRLEGRITDEVAEKLRRKGHTIGDVSRLVGGFGPILCHHPQPGDRGAAGRRRPTVRGLRRRFLIAGRTPTIYRRTIDA